MITKMQNKFIEGLEYLLKNRFFPTKKFTDYDSYDTPEYCHTSNATRYIFLHGLRRSDRDVEEFMFEVAKNTKICPVNVNNFRAGQDSGKIKMIDQLAILFHGLIEFYGGKENMHKKNIVISGHSQGSALAVALGQVLAYLFNMRVFCPIYCAITEGTNAAKIYQNRPGALDLVPNSNFMNFINDGFEVLAKEGNTGIAILPFAVRVPNKLQKRLSILRYISKNLSHFGEENDTILSYKSQQCLNVPEKFMYKKFIPLESLHERWENFVPLVKYVAKLLFRNVTPILAHPQAISETIRAILHWLKSLTA